MNVAHDTKVGNSEDRSLRILVDGDDILGTLHSDQMLGGARDAGGNVDRWFDHLAGLTNLV